MSDKDRFIEHIRVLNSFSSRSQLTTPPQKWHLICSPYVGRYITKLLCDAHLITCRNTIAIIRSSVGIVRQIDLSPHFPPNGALSTTAIHDLDEETVTLSGHYYEEHSAYVSLMFHLVLNWRTGVVVHAHTKYPELPRPSTVLYGMLISNMAYRDGQRVYENTGECKHFYSLNIRKHDSGANGVVVLPRKNSMVHVNCLGFDCQIVDVLSLQVLHQFTLPQPTEYSPPPICNHSVIDCRTVLLASPIYAYVIDVEIGRVIHHQRFTNYTMLSLGGGYTAVNRALGGRFFDIVDRDLNIVRQIKDASTIGCDLKKEYVFYSDGEKVHVLSKLLNTCIDNLVNTRSLYDVEFVLNHKHD